MHIVRRRRSSAPAAVLLAAVFLAGCAGAGGSGGGEPELGPVEADPATAGLSFPMDAYTDTEAERIRMGQVQQTLVSRCMARYGFTYEPVRPAEPAEPTGGEGAGDRHRYLFGLADPVRAAAHGYDKSAGSGTSAKPAAPQLSDSAYVVMNGEQPGARGGTAPDAATEEEAAQLDSGLTAAGQKVPAGGCAREGYRKLYAPTRDSVDLLFVFGLASEAHDRSKQDSRVVDVLKKWSACMDKSGYGGIRTPYDVVDKLGLDEDKAGPKAVTAAKADVACKRQVNLVGIWAAVEKAYQERLVDEHAETLALYKKQREARFKLAASLA
ncbi:hypothetical protein [Streptomyces sp. NBC_01294]|uniref:hypothetical protein n=1 Tax=Streptomyces sp. NBC_01294 TaxID=2903815 RepID=UPI002DDA2D33|nr:hypothetical protein [Streptomyces sp. NBC_01294]WRZ57719.1 hypothetical protein OG534_15175 [Streptomyces sp. NBC_01294]